MKWSGHRDSNPVIQLGRLVHNPYAMPAKMASTTGFEPVTYRLGSDCSIQLSYEDIAIDRVFLPDHIHIIPESSRLYTIRDIYRYEQDQTTVRGLR